MRKWVAYLKPKWIDVRQHLLEWDTAAAEKLKRNGARLPAAFSRNELPSGANGLGKWRIIEYQKGS
ncbi:MAG: hypothetical protein WKF84_17135 [Pyrinomonadaceae bacterium]